MAAIVDLDRDGQRELVLDISNPDGSALWLARPSTEGLDTLGVSQIGWDCL